MWSSNNAVSDLHRFNQFNTILDRVKLSGFVLKRKIIHLQRLLTNSTHKTKKKKSD